MRELLEQKFFPFVIKPGRYSGGEPGQIVKDPQNRTQYLLSFPDKYELGQSYVGLQSLYHIVNSDDRFLAERAFAVDRDAEEIMRREGIPLFSLESSRPAREFDAIGFTMTYELVFTNVLAMLDLAGIPLRSKDRTDDDPIILAGGPAVYNPEPIAPFIDGIFIGDGEDGLPEILSILHELKGRPRAEKLEQLARRVESLYVPIFYDDAHRPTESFAPAEIKARICRELKPEYYPAQPIVPLIDTVHDHLGVEIMRGCPQGCRFCQAGPMYRPIRVRSQADILHQVETQLTASGYQEVSLMSLSSSDYPEIESLASTMARRLADRRISISLPALRPGTIGPALLDAASSVRKSGLTLAPEAGTERLRLFIRKDFPDTAVFDSVRIAFDRGWTTLKLYFMVGLPTETEEDLLGILKLIERIYQISRDYAGKKTINVTLSPFMPKPHTPFQWDEIVPQDEVLRRIQLIKRNNRVRGVNFKYHTTESTVLQGIIGRGGREIADVIETVYREGGRFDGWSEDFNAENWFAAFEKHGIDVSERMRPIPFEAELPWGHIRKGVSTEHLMQERKRTARQLKDYQPRFVAADDPGDTSQPSLQFGRGKKKVPSRNTAAAPTKNRLRVKWGKSARLRYMSHLDNMRLMERAIRRGRLPVAYSQGYNPSMKLSFGPPLPLGFTSESEFVDITLDTPFLPYMLESLKKSMPPGLEIYEAQLVYGKSPSLSAGLNRVMYTLPVEGLEGYERLAEEIETLMSREEVIVDREGKSGTKQVDLRASVYDLRLDGSCLEMTLGVGDGGYVRPTEVVDLLLADSGGVTVARPFHRKNMFRQENDGRIISALDL